MNPINQIISDFENMSNEEYALLLKKANERTQALNRKEPVKITSLEFIFENCECATVDVKYVDDVKISNIRSSIDIQDSVVFESEYADYVKIKLVDYENLKYETCMDTKENLLNRLLHKDVTGIVLHFNNGLEKTFYVPWGDNDYVSEHMKIEQLKYCLTLTFDKEVKI